MQLRPSDPAPPVLNKSLWIITQCSPWSETRLILPSQASHINAELVIPQITPATITFTQLLFLIRVSHCESQVVRVQMFAGVLQHLLHFGYVCSGLAVGLLVVNPTAENHTQLADMTFSWQ
jgi:hypothetical protein